MGTDLVVPLTGEVIDLSGPTDTLAESYRQAQQAETKLRMFRAEVRGELLARMDKELLRKTQVGDFFLECEAPDQFEYDPDALSRILVRLVTEDKISRDAAAQAVKTVETLKVMKRGVDKLLSSPTITEQDKAEILGCRRPLQRERRLTIKSVED